MQLSPVNMEQRKNLDIKSGDTIRVWQRIEEKGKTRLQVFEGLVLARKHGTEAGASFTVRKISGGVGVELTLPLYSPKIEKIELAKRPRNVRRAKLYYLREKAAKAVRKKMKQMRQVDKVLMEKVADSAPEKENQDQESEEKKTEQTKEEPKE